MGIPNRGPELLAVNLVFLPMSLISVLLRCYVRLFMLRRFSTDDWLMVVAMIFFTLYCSFSITSTVYGTGRHNADLSPSDMQTAIKCQYFCEVWYSLSVVFAKLSIGFFLLRIVIERWQKWLLYLTMTATALTSFTFFFVSMLQCNPIPYFWDKSIEGGHCINIHIVIAIIMAYSVCAVISDLIFAILPGVIVWRLQAPLRTKLLLFPLLAMGAIASAAVIVRFPFLPKFAGNDFLWDTHDIAIWSTVEPGLAITAGSLATIRPLVRRVGYRLGISEEPIPFVGKFSRRTRRIFRSLYSLGEITAVPSPEQDQSSQTLPPTECRQGDEQTGESGEKSETNDLEAGEGSGQSHTEKFERPDSGAGEDSGQSPTEEGESPAAHVNNVPGNCTSS